MGASNDDRIFIINNPKLVNSGNVGYLLGNDHRPGIIRFDKATRNSKYKINLGLQRILTDNSVFGIVISDVDESHFIESLKDFTFIDLDSNSINEVTQIFNKKIINDVTESQFVRSHNTDFRIEGIHVYYFYMFMLLIYICNNNVEFEESTIMDANFFRKFDGKNVP